MITENSRRAKRQQAGTNVCVYEVYSFQALLISANSGLHSVPQWAPGAINFVCKEENCGQYLIYYTIM